MLEYNKTYNVDCLEGAKMLPDNSIDCIVTSPPYYGLRDYGVEGQIGLEQTPQQYIDRLVALFHELRRALKDTGTVWVNIGDSYAGSGRGIGDSKRSSQKQRSNGASYIGNIHQPFSNGVVKPKDIIGIPWMLAFAMRADGWYLRQDIIWHKPNPMPESVRDRCTKVHEYIFLFSKSPRYYFNAEAIAEPAAYDGRKDTRIKGSHKYSQGVTGLQPQTFAARAHDRWTKNENGEYVRNKRSVWTVTTKPCREAHFATYPEDLITPCILAGCPPDGVVLDPFNGSGTTRIAANKLNRNAVGFELNPEYIRIEERRRDKELGIFK